MPTIVTSTTPLEELAAAVALAGRCGAEVVIPIPAIQRLMLAAGHSVDWKWTDLADATGAEVSYDTALRACRLSLSPL